MFRFFRRRASQADRMAEMTRQTESGDEAAPEAQVDTGRAGTRRSLDEMTLQQDEKTGGVAHEQEGHAPESAPPRSQSALDSVPEDPGTATVEPDDVDAR